MKIVVDTNIIFSALLRDNNKYANALIKNAEGHNYFAVYFTLVELFKRKERIKMFSKNEMDNENTFPSRMDKTIVRRGKIEEQGNDFTYWQSKPYSYRLQAIEEIRSEFNQWKYGTEQGFQRVYRRIEST